METINYVYIRVHCRRVRYIIIIVVVIIVSYKE